MNVSGFIRSFYGEKSPTDGQTLDWYDGCFSLVLQDPKSSEGYVSPLPTIRLSTVRKCKALFVVAEMSFQTSNPGPDVPRSKILYLLDRHHSPGLLHTYLDFNPKNLDLLGLFLTRVHSKDSKFEDTHSLAINQFTLEVYKMPLCLHQSKKGLYYQRPMEMSVQ